MSRIIGLLFSLLSAGYLCAPRGCDLGTTGAVSAFQPTPRPSKLLQESWRRRHYCAVGNPLFSSPSNDEEEATTDFDSEETLMQLHFTVNEGAEKETAIEKLSRYCQSFPFAAVLPVQPLQYLPTTDGGVEVKFLRKKTKEKGSMDGGIRFFVSPERDGIDVVAKRNSQGQTVSKMFSEKLVVQAFVKSVTGKDDSSTTTNPPPTDVASLSSVFHKWMD